MINKKGKSSIFYKLLALINSLTKLVAFKFYIIGSARLFVYG